MKSIHSIKCPHCEQENTPCKIDDTDWRQRCAYCKEKINVRVVKEEGVYYFEATKA